MVSSQATNAYQQTVMRTNYHPVELIHMLYERVLVHLELAEKAILEKQPESRGEHLAKAIAIVTELYVSVEQDDSESSQFLLGLYEAILAELPKVGASKDVEILRRSHRYLKRLNEVWEDTAMRENGFFPQERSEASVGGVASPDQPSPDHGILVKEREVSPAPPPGGRTQISFSV